MLIIIESFLIHNLPLFCLTFDQQFTVSTYKDFLQLVLTINLYLDYQLYSLLQCLCLCGSLIVKRVHFRIDTILSPAPCIFSNTFLCLFPHLQDCLL